MIYLTAIKNAFRTKLKMIVILNQRYLFMYVLAEFYVPESPSMKSSCIFE